MLYLGKTAFGQFLSSTFQPAANTVESLLSLEGKVVQYMIIYHNVIKNIILCFWSSVPLNFFLAKGHAIFQGVRTKYSTLIYKSTLAYCRFRPCRVR